MTVDTQRPFTSPRVLICEGYDDICFFQRLISVHNLPIFHVVSTASGRYDRGGNTKFGAKLSSIRLNPNFDFLTDILLVSDNDNDHGSSFENICRQISGAEFEPPIACLTKTNNVPSITVMMIPLDKSPGNLESICIEAAESSRSGRLVSSSVHKFRGMLDTTGWQEPRLGKMWLRSYLAATATDPFLPLSAVFAEDEYQNLIPVRHASFKPILTVLKSFAPLPDGDSPQTDPKPTTKKLSEKQPPIQKRPHSRRP